ncbi:antitoxin Xre/MbcA/ParS-like domain-containing protein [Bradyrhizobium sp. Arg314]
MTRFQNPTDGISQEALAGLVAEAVQQALIQHGIDLDTQTLVSASTVAGSLAAAVPFLPQAQQRVIGSFKGECTALASEFFRALADFARGGLASANSADESPIPATAGPSSLQRANDLQSVLIEDWAGEVAGSTYLEEHFRIPRSTLHHWQRRNEVVALRKGGRKHVFPLAQFVDGRPASGIREVLLAIGNPRLAWFWLTRPSPELDGRVPIEVLKQDIVCDVVSAVHKFSSA